MNILAILFAIGFGIAAVAVIVALRAFVIVNLWSWFVVPIFGLPQLNYLSAIALMLVVEMWVGTIFKYSYDGVGIKQEIAWDKALLSPLIALGLGYIISFYI